MPHPTRYWHRLDDGRIQCDVCPRACKMHEGQRGLCFVRGAEAGEIQLYTYGRSSGFCVDPIEKKPLNHFLPGTSVLSFGTAGCNLACKFCFHPDTLVATAHGMRRIAELFDACKRKVSDEDGQIGFPASLEVWTRQAEKARVAKVFAHPYSGGLLRLKAACCPPLLLTPNHKVFAAHRSNLQDIRPIEAASLSMQHYLVVPKRSAGGGGVQLDVTAILETAKTSAHAPRLRRMPLEQLTALLQATGTSAELSETLGYHRSYIRTLHSRLARGLLEVEQPSAIRLRVGASRVKFARERGAGMPRHLELTPDLAWLLGFYCAEGSIGMHPQRPNAYQLVFSCGHHEQHLVERTARLLTELLGSQTVTVIRAYLDGYMTGDGYKAKAHVVGNTVSRDLALGLFELGLHLDLLPSFFVHEPEPTKRIEGREVSQSTAFIVKFKRDRYEQRARSDPERTCWRDAGDNFLVPLRQIERVPYDGLVYNLEVDHPDHSYLAPFLAVSNCQNWDMSKSREMDTLADRATPQMLAAAAKRLGCASIAYTYNDPVIFMEYAMDVADACREQGIKSVAVTAGYMCDAPRAEFYRHMDAANVDLKGFTERFYRKVCGAELGSVLETLDYLKTQTRVWFEITTLLIPGENDSDAEIDAMTQWIMSRLGPDVPLHFTAFHPDWKMLDKPATPAATLTRAREIAIKNGLRYVYTGNVHDPIGSSTYCHGCNARVIERDWYRLGEWRLDAAGACLKCGTPIPGVFSGPPGAWGARRLPVRLSAASEDPRERA